MTHYIYGKSICVKRELWTYVKIPTHIWPAPFMERNLYLCERDLYVYGKRPIDILRLWEGTYIYVKETYMYMERDLQIYDFGVATDRRLLKIIGLFCKRAPLKTRYSAKETYTFKEPTSCSHPIAPSLLRVRTAGGATTYIQICIYLFIHI